MATRTPVAETEISQLLHTEREIAPPASLVAQARMPDFAGEYRSSVEDTDNFWAGVARELEWFRPWDKVFEWTYPTFQWFGGARCNITHNCLDRNVRNGRKNKIAYI